MDLTTLILIALTIAAGVASVLGLKRLKGEPAGGSVGRWQRGLIWLCTLGAGALFVYRAVWVHDVWQPLHAHIDGLLLIAPLLGATVLYLQHPSRIPGVGVFAGPMLVLILAWAICASAWTLKLFDIDSVWKAIHLASVYLGTLLFAMAAVAGVMFLYAQRRLRSKAAPVTPSPEGGRRFASLESIETLIIRTSALGFGLLSLGLVTGLVIVSQEQTRLGPGWWYSPKVVLAAAVWLIFALVMNVRHTASFRGSRAAWLSITGMALLLATMAIAINLPDLATPTPPTGGGP